MDIEFVKPNLDQRFVPGGIYTQSDNSVWMLVREPGKNSYRFIRMDMREPMLSDVVRTEDQVKEVIVNTCMCYKSNAKLVI